MLSTGMGLDRVEMKVFVKMFSLILQVIFSLFHPSEIMVGVD